MKDKTYLGDDLYASDDGFQICLTAQRGYVNHEVYLDPGVLLKFFRFVEKTRNIKIVIKRED